MRTQKMRAILAWCAVAGVTAALGVVAAPSPALAAGTGTTTTATTPTTLPSTVTADALPTWQVNGVVWSEAIAGNTVYVTGSFSKARPPGVAPGGAGEVAANNVFAFNLQTGNRVTSFNHSLNGQGLVVKASADGTRVYVGGDFTTVDGQAHNHLVAFNTATNAVDNSFSPSLSGQVRALGITASTIYVGGNFLAAQGQSRTRLAAYSTSGTLLPWAPSATGGYVWAMTMSPDRSKVVAGGSFTTLSGVAAPGMGALDSSSGAVLPWAATNKIHDSGADGAITSLSSDGSQIYGTSYSFSIPNANFEGPFALDPQTGDIIWANDCQGDTYAGAPAGNVYYYVSHEHDCHIIGGWPDTNPRVFWQHTEAVTTYPVGTTTLNDMYGWDYRGYQYSQLLHWYPTLGIGTYTGMYQAGWSVATNGDYVVLGGEFPSVNGVAQQGLTRMAVSSLATNKQGPTYSSKYRTGIPPTTAVSFSNGTARISFGTAWDPDNETLTYELYRDGRPTSLSTQIASTFWNLPNGGFVDTGLTPGSQHTYQIRITDPSGNVQWSPKSNVVTVASGTLSTYAQDTINAGAGQFWRLNEASGTTAYDWSGFDDATLNGTYTHGAAGPIGGDASDAATTFDGSTAFAADGAAQPGPNVFSVEGWFKTTSRSGGVIVGFGDKNTGLSSNYDRHIYMDAAGHVMFGVWNSGAYTVGTSSSFNDGQWHFAVGTLDSTGLTLYVDGRRIGHNSGTSTAQDYSGYWRIGGDNTWSGNPYFAGDIADVAVFPSVLSVTQVQQQFIDSGRTLNVPTRPTDAYGAAVWDANPDIYWRLGEASGPTAHDSSANMSDGVYSSAGVTYGVPGAITGTTNTAISLDGSFGNGVASGTAQQAPSVYSEEAWFKTTTTSGGKIIGFGNAQTGNSTNYDRHVYMTNTGQLVFGTWTGSENTVTTSASYNDGQWHQVVATQGPSGMALYVDGQLVGTNPQTQAQSYAGFWRVGGDRTWSGASSDWFTGSIDDVSIYSTVLSASEVLTQYQAGSGVVANQPPTASFTATPTNLTVAVDGSASSDPDGTIASYAWQFGDGSTGTGATASHTYAAAGTYTVTLTVTDNGGATGTSTQQVTVTAPNQPPTASFTATPTNLTVAVDGSASSDPDGTIASYAWQFGDGSTGTGATASHTYAAAGTYTVTLTVTDNGGATAMTTKQVTVSAAAATAFASDTFSRTVSNGWGTADLGGSWSIPWGASRFSVANGVGKISLDAGSGVQALLSGVSSSSTEVSMSVSPSVPPTGGGDYITLMGRVIDSKNDYRGKVLIAANGKVYAYLVSNINGTSTTLAWTQISGLTYTAGDQLQIRLQVDGTSPTTLRIKVWKAGTTEPTTWAMTATDSTAALQTTGSVGIYEYVSGSSTNTPAVIENDNFWAGPLQP